MSGLGQTEKSDRPPGMSVLPPIADIVRLHAQVRFVPGRDSCTATRARLFDHLVGASKQGWRHGDTERLRGLQVNDQFKFNWLLNR
jgi:hypothetical protein